MNINNNDLEWLGKAAFGSETSIINIQDNSAIALDGYRIHMIDAEQIPEKIKDINIKETVDKFNNAIASERVLVNVDYLIDALSGMQDYPNNQVYLSISIVNENQVAIVIDDHDSYHEKQAIIMCCEIIEDDYESY